MALLVVAERIVGPKLRRTSGKVAAIGPVPSVLPRVILRLPLILRRVVAARPVAGNQVLPAVDLQVRPQAQLRLEEGITARPGAGHKLAARLLRMRPLHVVVQL